MEHKWGEEEGVESIRVEKGSRTQVQSGQPSRERMGRKTGGVGAQPLQGSRVTRLPRPLLPNQSREHQTLAMAPGSDAFSSHQRRTWSPLLDHGPPAEPSSSTHAQHMEDLKRGVCLFLGDGKSGTWLEEEMEGKQVFFFQEESGRTFLSLRKRHRGLVLDWWVFQFLAVQISFPWTPHLLLKSSRALAFLLFSLITLLGGGVTSYSSIISGNVVLPVLEKTLSGVSVIRRSLDGLRGCQGEGFVGWIKLGSGAPLLELSGSNG